MNKSKDLNFIQKEKMSLSCDLSCKSWRNIQYDFNNDFNSDSNTNNCSLNMFIGAFEEVKFYELILPT